MIAAAALLLLLQAPQTPQESERPKFDFEESGKFMDLVRKLGKATKCQVRMMPGIEDKEVKISLKQAGFYEALDALCRAHGHVQYFLPKRMPVTDEVTLAAGEWVEYPASYHEHFKVVIPYLTRTRGGSIEGSGEWVSMGLALLAPPWIRVTYGAGAHLEWKLEEARGKDGRDLLLKNEEEGGFREFNMLMGESAQHGNVADTRFRLKDFDITESLQTVAGQIELTAKDSKVIRVELEVGKSVDVPGGKLTVDSLTEMGQHGRGKRWRVGLTFAPKEGEKESESFRSVLEDYSRFEGDFDWIPTFPKWNGDSVELDSFGLPRQPAWMSIRVRTGDRKSKVQFRFKSVSFKKEF